MTIFHPSNEKDRVAMEAMRVAIAPIKGSLSGPSARVDFDTFMDHVSAADGVSYKSDKIGGVTGWWCTPEYANSHSAILYLHGGAYVVGSASAYRNFAGNVAKHTGVAVFVPDYSLAPERPFPAAINDAKAVYVGLLSNGYTNVALAGDSAGGGLALSLISALIEDDKITTIPVAVSVISPWTDLALTGASIQIRAAADPLLTPEELHTMAKMYLGKQSALNPLASPLYAKLRGSPPIRVDVGQDEILLDDSIRFGERALQNGVQIDVHVWEDMVHVFPSNIALLEASTAALVAIGTFLKQYFVRLHK